MSERRHLAETVNGQDAKEETRSHFPCAVSKFVINNQPEKGIEIKV